MLSKKVLSFLVKYEVLCTKNTLKLHENEVYHTFISPKFQFLLNFFTFAQSFRLDVLPITEFLNKIISEVTTPHIVASALKLHSSKKLIHAVGGSCCDRI